jgi:serine/threonine-protein kinase mTOR
MRSQMIHNLCSIVSISKKRIEEHVNKLTDVIVEFWGDHISELIKLSEEIAIALHESFSPYLTKILPLLLECLDDDKCSLNVLQAFIIYRGNLNDHLDMIIPPILKILEKTENEQMRLMVCKFIHEMCSCLDMTDYSSRIIISFCYSLNSHPELHNTIMETLCLLLLKLEKDFVIFIPTIYKILIKNQIYHTKYEEWCYKLLEDKPLPIEFLNQNKTKAFYSLKESEDEDESNRVKKMYINEVNLKKSWYAAQRSTSEDWNDWIKQFQLTLLSESPSPELRACATLAQIFQPIARELFNASFFAVWRELEEETKKNLVNSLVLALIFPNLPHDILQVLLNLVEFMEHQPDPLPLSINVLGTLSSKAGKNIFIVNSKELMLKLYIIVKESLLEIQSNTKI